MLLTIFGEELAGPKVATILVFLKDILAPKATGLVGGAAICAWVDRWDFFNLRIESHHK